MKKSLIVIFFIMLMPFLVNAKEKVHIESVELVNKSELVATFNEPRFSSLEAKLNGQFFQKDDAIQYKVLVANDTDDDYVVGVGNADSNYLDYEIESENRIIKANSKQNVIVKVTYANLVNDNDYVGSRYVEDKNVPVTFTKINPINPIVNPDTGQQIVLIASIFVISLVAFLVLYKRSKKSLLVFLGLGLLFIPAIYAVETIKINIGSHYLIMRNLPNDCQIDFTTIPPFQTNLVEGNNYCFGGWCYIYKPTVVKHEFYPFFDGLDSVDFQIPGWEIMGLQSEAILTDPVCRTINGDPVNSIGRQIFLALGDIDWKLFDTSNVQYMINLFEEKDEQTINELLPYLDTSSAVDLSGMFFQTYVSNLDLSSMNTDNVKNMSFMFGYAGFYQDELKLKFGDNFNTSNVETMHGMFYDNNIPNLDLKNFDTKKVKNMMGMFYNGVATNLDVSSFDTRSVENLRGAFAYLGGWEEDKPYASIKFGKHFTNESLISMAEMFYGTKFHDLDLSDLDTSNVIYMDEMFRGVSADSINIKSFDTSKVESMYYMFAGANIKELDLSNFDTSKVISMDGMFRDMEQLEKLNISSFDTSRVQGMSYMFMKCKSLKKLDLRHFNTSEVRTIHSMFSELDLDKLDLSRFDTSKVYDMYGVFTYSKIGELNLSGLNTSNVTDMSFMFFEAEIDDVDFSSFDTSKVRDMSVMFERFKTNSLDISNFNTSNVTDMESMFSGIKLDSLDLTNFDTSKVTNMSRMFNSADIPVLDLSSFDTSSLKVDSTWRDGANKMFENCTATTGYARTQADANRFNNSTDKPNGLIFTLKE